MQINACSPSPIQFFVDTATQVRKSLCRVFSTLVAIQKDGNATIKLLKVCRFAIFAFRAYHGKNPGSSVGFKDLDAVVNLMEGCQFLGVISSLLPVRAEPGKPAEEQAPILDRITDAAFSGSDVFQGGFWLLSKGVRFLGPFSDSEMVVQAFDMLSLAFATVGSATDGTSAVIAIINNWKISVPNTTSAIWQLGERVTGAVAFIFIMAGASGTLATVATGLIAASALCGIIRFVYNLEIPEEISQT